MMPVIADGLDSHIVVGIQKSQILDIQQGDDTIPVAVLENLKSTKPHIPGKQRTSWPALQPYR